MMPKYAAFNAAADRVIADQLLKTRIIAAAVAMAVAGQADMPSAAVDNPSMHFNSVVLSAATRELSELNENLIFDAKLAIEYARTLWMVRYNAAHPPARPVYTTNCTTFEAVAGVGFCVSQDVYEFCNANKVAILTLSALACELLCEMRASGEDARG
jgi:hypothetical protein